MHSYTFVPSHTAVLSSHAPSTRLTSASNEQKLQKEREKGKG